MAEEPNDPVVAPEDVHDDDPTAAVHGVERAVAELQANLAHPALGPADPLEPAEDELPEEIAVETVNSETSSEGAQPSVPSNNVSEEPNDMETVAPPQPQAEAEAPAPAAEALAEAQAGPTEAQVVPNQAPMAWEVDGRRHPEPVEPAAAPAPAAAAQPEVAAQTATGAGAGNLPRAAAVPQITEGTTTPPLGDVAEAAGINQETLMRAISGHVRELLSQLRHQSTPPSAQGTSSTTRPSSAPSPSNQAPRTPARSGNYQAQASTQETTGPSIHSTATQETTGPSIHSTATQETTGPSIHSTATQETTGPPNSQADDQWESTFNDKSSSGQRRYCAASMPALSQPVSDLNKENVTHLCEEVGQHASHHGIASLFILRTQDGEIKDVAESPSSFNSISDRQQALEAVQKHNGTVSANKAIVNSIRKSLSNKALKTLNSKKKDFTVKGVQVASLILMVLNEQVNRNRNASKRELSDRFTMLSMLEQLKGLIRTSATPMQDFELEVLDSKSQLEKHEEYANIDSKTECVENLVRAVKQAYKGRNSEFVNFMGTTFLQAMDDPGKNETFTITEVLNRSVSMAETLGLEKAGDSAEFKEDNKGDDYLAMSAERHFSSDRSTNALASAPPLSSNRHETKQTDYYHGWNPNQDSGANATGWNPNQDSQAIPRRDRPGPDTQAGAYAALRPFRAQSSSNGLVYGAQGRPSPQARRGNYRPSYRTSSRVPHAPARSGSSRRQTPDPYGPHPLLKDRWVPPPRPSGDHGRAPPPPAPSSANDEQSGHNFDGVRHTQNYKYWKAERRPGDGDRIKVEVWFKSHGSGNYFRPTQVDYRTAHWCPHRNQYCFIDPETFLSMVQESQQQSAQDRWVASVAEATNTTQSRGNGARHRRQRPRHA